MPSPLDHARTYSPISDPKRILVFTKYRFIGDTLLAIPTLRAASLRWPAATITLVTGARACELLENCPYVHEFVEFDPYRDQDRGLRCYLGLIRRLRRRRYDLALVLNRSFHGALTAALGGARIRAGWGGFQSRDFLLQRLCAYHGDDPEIISYLDILRLAAPDVPVDTKLDLWVTERERREVPATLQSTGEWIGIQPGASHSYKQWSPDRFARVIEDLLRDGPRRRVVLLGGEDEKIAAEAVLRNCTDEQRNRIVDCVGLLPLRQTLGVLTRLSLFVGNDTAVRHAAVALDVPSIGIFGPTSARKWGNAAPPRHQVIASVNSSMESVSVEEVSCAIRSQFLMPETRAVSR